jgi:hypothetical protein
MFSLNVLISDDFWNILVSFLKQFWQQTGFYFMIYVFGKFAYVWVKMTHLKKQMVIESKYFFAEKVREYTNISYIETKK